AKGAPTRRRPVLPVSTPRWGSSAGCLAGSGSPCPSWAMCRSLPLGCLFLLRPRRHELGVVAAAVEEDHAVQFVPLHHGPAPALRRVHLVVAVPGPLHGGLAVPGRQAAVHVPVAVAEVELPAAPVVKREVAFFLLVDVVLVPGAHRHDPPAALERGRGFRLLGHFTLLAVDPPGCTGSGPCGRRSPEPPGGPGARPSSGRCRSTSTPAGCLPAGWGGARYRPPWCSASCGGAP